MYEQRGVIFGKRWKQDFLSWELELEERGPRRVGTMLYLSYSACALFFMEAGARRTSSREGVDNLRKHQEPMLELHADH